MIIASFLFFLLIFVFIGVMSVRYAKSETADYLLAGRNVPAWLTALSAIATNNSGFMFVGLIGMTYTMGISASWLMIGWIFGDWLSWHMVHSKLRLQSDKNQNETYASILAGWHGKEHKWVRLAAALITIIFLGTYAAAQLNAGGKALHVLFGWDYATGALIGTGIVLMYCFAGGIRASIWTDAAQSAVMVIAMALLLIVSFDQIGGITNLWDTLHKTDPQLVAVFPQDLAFGPLLFVLGWVFAGVGVIGQPHIMVRFMAIDDAKHLKKARRYYFSWYIVFSTMAVLVGLASRILIPEVENFDAELALPSLSLEYMPGFVTGLILAALFAATMSTADSQVLSCSASLTQDIAPHHKNFIQRLFKKDLSYLYTKLGTVLVTGFALTIALTGNKSVFDLVVVAWSVLASAFGPLLLVYTLGQKVNQATALGMMASGLAALFTWRYLGYSGDVYEVLPGMAAGFSVFVLVRVLMGKPKEKNTARNA